jgi:hypothetical protein
MTFDTDNLRIRVTERHAAMYFDPRALFGTRGTPYEEAPPLIRYVADRMALVATPYWPCTDLK